MELRQLECFVAAAEEGGFSRGAHRCGMAQPSLSQQIRNLELQLRRKLFDRIGRGVELSEAGSALLPRAQAILAQVGDLSGGIEEDLASGRGPITVAALPTIAPYLLPELVLAFRRRCPEAEVSIRENFTDTLVAAVVGLEVDVALTSLPIKEPRVVAEPLFEEPLLLAVPTGHPFATAEHVTDAELRATPAVLMHDMHCLGEQARSFCDSRGLLDHVACETTQLSTMLSLVKLGMGISFVPEMCARQDTSGGVAYINLGERGPSRAIAAVTRPERAKRFLVREFSKLARELAR